MRERERYDILAMSVSRRHERKRIFFMSREEEKKKAKYSTDRTRRKKNASREERKTRETKGKKKIYPKKKNDGITLDRLMEDFFQLERKTRHRQA